MKLDVQIAHTVDEIGQEAWDRLSAGRPFTSYHWYCFGEAVLANDTPIYIILSQGNEPVARATFWLRRQEALPISSTIVRHVIEMVLHRWPLLICQSPLIEASGLVLPDPPLRDAALETIAQVAKDQARQQQVSFLVWAYLDEHEARYPAWPDAFVPIKVPGPLTCLDIAWPDFESYYNHLSKSTRAQYRQNCNRAADLGIEVKCHPMTQSLDDDTLDEAAKQIWNVEKYHNSGPTPWARMLLKHAGMVGGIFIKTEIGGHLVGNFTVLGDGDTWKMTMLGRDYRVRYAYFQLIYTAIRCAIEERAKALWGGSGVYEMKQKLGFKLVHNNYDVFAGNGPLLQRLGCWVAKMEENKAASPL